MKTYLVKWTEYGTGSTSGTNKSSLVKANNVNEAINIVVKRNVSKARLDNIRAILKFQK